MSGTSTVTAAVGFVDQATFSELESWLYGGPLAISYFVAGVQKANWFSIVPIQLRQNGTFEFGARDVSASINRSGDYVLNVWFRMEIPTIVSTNGQDANANVRWTRNLMHNIIERCYITFNELIVEEFNSYWLDYNYMFRLPTEKRVGYKNMIGDIASLTTPLDGTLSAAAFAATGNGRPLWGGYFTLVMPFWFGEDSGIALPVAALPFNDVKINYCFRSIEDLLVFRGGLTTAGLTNFSNEISSTTGVTTGQIINTGAPRMANAQTNAHYAVIHNDERTKMGDAPRDMLIRQIQPVSSQQVQATATQIHYDLRLSHAIISFFFGMMNNTQKGEWSNYTTNFDYGITGQPLGQQPQPQGGSGNATFWNPIERTHLTYENTVRLDSQSDFYALIHPYLYSDAIPDETGYNMWTYSLKPWDCLSPAGSTNYSKLANVTLYNKLSNVAIYYLNHNLVNLGTPLKLKTVFIAQNWNIARVANGSLGHPTL